MNKKLKLRLRKLEQHYANMHELLLSMLDDNDGGHWFANDERVLFSNATEGTSICQEPDGTLYLESSSAPESKEAITDQRIIDLINEIRPKKKVAKKKAEPKKNYKNATYMDVFKRVVGIMNDKTGFAPYDDIEDEENGEIDICTDYDGDEHKTWSNAKAFVGGDPEESSIFEEVADLDAKYEKLASRWDAEFASSCRILGKVDVKDTSPAGIMKALDKAGL